MMESRYKGCLLGLAVGDALGAPIEFLSLQQIKMRYGERGLIDFDSWGGFPAGYYTDDTQMALATAVGCIRAWQRQMDRGICHPASMVYSKYLDWLETQKDPEQVRAPGDTCLSALESGKMGTVLEPINDSKGCGGVMRTAPAGLAFPAGDAFKQGVEFAALTHGHPSGYLTAGVLAELTAQLITGKGLRESLVLSMSPLVNYRGHGETLEYLKLAMELADSNLDVETVTLQVQLQTLFQERFWVSGLFLKNG